VNLHRSSLKNSRRCLIVKTMVSTEETGYTTSFPSSWSSLGEPNPGSLSTSLPYHLLPLNPSLSRPVQANAVLGGYRVTEIEGSTILLRDFAYSADGTEDFKNEAPSIKLQQAEELDVSRERIIKKVSFLEDAHDTSEEPHEEVTQYSTVYPADWTISTTHSNNEAGPPLPAILPAHVPRVSQGDAVPRFHTKQRAKSVFIPREKMNSRRLVVTEYGDKLRLTMNENFPTKLRGHGSIDEGPRAHINIAQIAADNEDFHRRHDSSKSNNSLYHSRQVSAHDAPAKMRRTSSTYSSFRDGSAYPHHTHFC
jgi:hypothetical protein